VWGRYLLTPHSTWGF